MTLRSRLAATYAAMIFIALLIFAAAAVIAIDRTLRATMDSRLRTEAYAAASLADIQDGRLVADKEDRAQFVTLLAAGDDALALDARGRIVFSSAASPPADILAIAHGKPRFFTVGRGDSVRRALVFPIVRDGIHAGTVVVWRASAWIDETDRGAAVAFGIAALVIALLAVVAGGAVTRGALEDAFARQRRFTADASHELRAPLSVIRAEADLALRKDRPLEEYKAAMASIAAEADRLESLIGDLLSVARAEGGTVARTRVEVSAVVNEVAARLSPAAAAKEARFELHVLQDAAVLADRQALERAVLAIAHNAVKYAPAHGRIEMVVRRAGRNVDISVRDDGPGFTPEALTHALERFWKEDTARPQSGTGLGLSIAKSIIEAFGGNISVENTGSGAAVRMRLPAA
jgi:signal transduction histidine kinase